MSSRQFGTLRATVASFCYHDVTENAADSGVPTSAAMPFKLRPNQVADHLDAIAQGRAAPELATDIDLGRPGRHLVLTFDDGGKSALRIADQLDRRGWRGHFFICTGFIGRRTFLDASEIRQLRGAGHAIGSHSHSHPNIYRELGRERMTVEWRQSCDILAQLLGEPCTTGSVPGGDISDEVLRSADHAGLRYLFTSEPWLQPRIVGGCRILGRFCAKSNSDPETIAHLAAFEGWQGKLMVHRIKGVARRGIPPLHRLYPQRFRPEWQTSSP
jgi:peptidoglycan/xylan/chitin deacetylase (PgdA/CDA1 family)